MHGVNSELLLSLFFCWQTRMQSLQPDPAARYRNVMDALRRIVATEGVLRPMRGLNATAVGAGPAHALYFACYEKLKKTLSDVIHPGANSHLANGTIKHTSTYINCECASRLYLNLSDHVKVKTYSLDQSSSGCEATSV